MSENSRKRPRESAEPTKSDSTAKSTLPSAPSTKRSGSSQTSTPALASSSNASNTPVTPPTPPPVVELKPVSLEEHRQNAEETLNRLLSLQHAMNNILHRKLTLGDDFAGDQTTFDELAKIRESFITMKSKFRQVQLDTETKKEHALRTQELLKQPHAQLQNLLYEKRHLESEIKTCHSFKKAAENQVELIDEEQFFREAPPQFLPAEGATEHEVLMKRLQYELEQRKVLKKELSELQARKTVLANEKAAKVRHLDNLLAKVRELEIHSAPILKEFAHSTAPEQFKKFEGNAARLLPKALYNLLYILVGWISASEDKHLTVSISGSEQEAQKESSARSKMGQHKDVHKSHPLSVHLTFVKPSGSSSTLPFPFIVKFFYLAAFDIVTVQCEAGGKDLSDTLKDLYPGDDGLACPNPAGLLLATGDENASSFSAAVKGRAYRWAQWLSGFRHLNPSESQASIVSGDAATDKMDVDTGSPSVEQGVSPIRVKDVVEKIKAKLSV